MVLPSRSELISVAPNTSVVGWSSSAKAGVTMAMHTAMASRLRAGRLREGASGDGMGGGFLYIVKRY
ncbi:hypothetical protein D3C80_1697340 [compost metagenome]